MCSWFPRSRLLALCCLLSAATTGGCATSCAPGGGDGGTDAGPSGLVVINELMAANDTTITDDFGQADDWVELYNPGGAPVSLAGYRLSDDEDEPDRFVFPDDVELAPGAFLLVWADREPFQGSLHADFRLAREGEVLQLTDPDGALVNRVTFGALDDDESFGRLPDGEGEPRVLETATPGAPNGGDMAPADGGAADAGADDAGLDAGAGDAGQAAVEVVINELSPAPTTPLEDAEGDLVTLPWVELLNTGAAPVDLSDHYLSDDPQDPTQSPIGGLAVLQPGDRFVVFGNSDPASGGLYHGTFELSPAGGTLVFASPAGEILERVDYGPASPGTSLGRSPDGEGSFVAQAAPTPRDENAGPAPPGDGGAGDGGAGDGGAGDGGAGDGGDEADAGTADGGAVEDAGALDGGITDAG